MSIKDTVNRWLNGRSELTKDGSEIPDPRPVALPVGFERPESIQDMIRRLVQDPTLRAELDGKDIETFDDADDFEVDDDLPVHSPYEENFDPMHLTAREQELRGGAVRDWTHEEKLEAKRVIDDARAAKAAKAAAAAGGKADVK